MKHWRMRRLQAGLMGITTIFFVMWGCGRERVNPIDPNFSGSDALSPPGNIRAVGDIGRITLNWGTVNSTTLAGYGLWRSTSATEGFVRLRGEAADTAVTTARTTFVDTTLNLSAAKIYFYKLNTVDVGGRSSELSPFVSAEALEDGRPPNVPTGLSAVTDINTGNVSLTWTAPQTDTGNQLLTGLSDYKIFRSKDSQDAFVQVEIVPAGQTTFSDPDELEVDARYFYLITATDPNGNESGRSSSISLTTAGTGVAPPAGLSATLNQEARIVISWNSVSDPNLLGYLVLRSESTEGIFSPISTDTLFTTGQTQYIDSLVVAEQVYFYKVQTVIQDPERGLVRSTESTFSDGLALPVVEVIIPLVSGLRTTESVGQIVVSWNPVNDPNLLGYLVLRSQSTQGTFVPVTADTLFTTGQTQYTDTEVVTDQVYFYKIRTIVQDPELGLLRSEISTHIDGKALLDQNPPGAPSDLIVSLDDNNFQRVILNWTAPTGDSNGGDLTGLATFQIFRSRETNASFALLTSLTGDLVTYQDTSVDLLTRYFYAISAVDSAGNTGPRSTAVSVTTKGFVVPRNLSATGSVQKITLTWAANSEPELTGYELLRFTDPAQENPDQTFSSVLTTYVDTPVTAGQTFVYRVRAVGSSDVKSELSTFVSAQANEPPAVLAAPSSVRATGGIGRITITWSANTEVELTGYRVLRYTDPSQTTADQTFTTVQTKYVDSPLALGQTFVYRVQAVGTNNVESDRSLFASATVSVDDVSPATPRSFAAVLRSSTAIDLSWSAPKKDSNNGDLTGLSGFIIYRVSGTSSAGLTALAVLDSTRRTYEDGGLENSTTYIYQISAVDANGNESSRSSSVSLTTEATTGSSVSAPTNLQATYNPNNTPSDVSLTWTAPSSFDSFLIQRAEVTAGGSSTNLTYTTLEFAQSGTAYTDTNIQSNITYVYRVSTNLSGSISDPSTVAFVVVP
jgi:fibronectin type 3 domain-containing protein